MKFDQLFEKTYAETHFRKGGVVSGKVIKLEGSSVVVDIGYKSEGVVPVGEFMDRKGKLTIKEGDTVSVYIDMIENDEGIVVLSKEKADQVQAWEKITKAVEGNEIVEGVVVSRIKGGLAVDIGVRAFLPGSQVDLRSTSNLDQYIGKTFKFKVIKFNRRRGNIVLSRKALLEKEREKLKENTLGTIREGQVVQGIVKNITDYGAFVDLGGIDGLLHVTDMSWGRIRHPSEVVNLGQEIDVMVLSYDQERERVSLGLKQLLPDPWKAVASRYTVGNKVKGKVVSLTDYGAFVELENGVEGLIHVSEMSWSKRITHPSKAVSVGQGVEVVVLNVDEGSRRISLGLKQMELNPWELLKEKYPEGMQVKGFIKNVTDFGVFVGLEGAEVDGLIHLSDLSWTEQEDPRKVYHKGETVEAVVLQIDPVNQKFSLGIKQLVPDPRAETAKKYKKNSHVVGTVKAVEREGIRVELEPPMEGFIPREEVSLEKKYEEIMEELKAGDNIEGLVLEADIAHNRVKLSVKALEKREERETVKKYLGSKRGEEAKTSLGEIIGTKEKGED